MNKGHQAVVLNGLLLGRMEGLPARCPLPFQVHRCASATSQDPEQVRHTELAADPAPTAEHWRADVRGSSRGVVSHCTPSLEGGWAAAQQAQAA